MAQTKPADSTEETKGELSCNFCESSFSNRDDLRVHVKSKHGDQQRTKEKGKKILDSITGRSDTKTKPKPKTKSETSDIYECPDCGQTFSSPRQLSGHRGGSKQCGEKTSANNGSGLSALETYETMSKREQAFIDAAVQFELDGLKPPSKSGQRGVEFYSASDIMDAMESQGVKPYVEAYISELHAKHRDVIDARKELSFNDRGTGHEGKIKTEGTEEAQATLSSNKGNASYTGPPLDHRYQYISERPVKDIARNGDRIDITFSLSLDEIFEVIRSIEDDEQARQVFEQVMNA